MTSIRKTLKDLKNTKTEYLLVRHIKVDQVDDLDILVRQTDFEKLIRQLKPIGYKEYSHDAAFGGRIYRAQVNLVKRERVKIDLHNDFTWRKQRYLDTELLWKSKKKKNISGVSVSVPDETLDVFLIIINIIFEKTYVIDEYALIGKYIHKIEMDKRVIKQAQKYNYTKTLARFFSWFKNSKKLNEPLFLPASLVIFSYWEKIIWERSFNLKSFAYYFFFRGRYFVNKTLPYD